MLFGAFSKAQISIACALCASIAFSLNDAIIKALSTSYPLHQVVLVRAVVALALTLAIFVPAEGGWKVLQTRRPLAHFLRGLFLVIANMAFFAAIAVIPLAEVTAIFFVAPFLITIFTALFLGEVAGRRRWLALCVGAIGVLLIVRPGGAGFQWAMLLPLLAATAYAGVHTLTRNLGLAEHASTMSVYVHSTFVVVALLAGIFLGDGRFAGSGNPSLEFIFRPWSPIKTPDLLIMIGGGALIACAGYMISQAYRLSEAGLIAPFEYLVLVLAVFWGYFFWDEVPTALSGAGIILILGTGLYVAIRETRSDGLRRPWRISGRR